MNQIKFSHNWNNKLNCNFFTTIRGYTEQKLIYYKNNIRGDFEIILKNKLHCISRLVDVRKYDKLSLVDRTVLMCDVGEYQVEKVFGIFAKFKIKSSDPVILLTINNLF
jgi:hypothetical protein